MVTSALEDINQEVLLSRGSVVSETYFDLIFLQKRSCLESPSPGAKNVLKPQGLIAEVAADGLSRVSHTDPPRSMARKDRNIPSDPRKPWG